MRKSVVEPHGMSVAVGLRLWGRGQWKTYGDSSGQTLSTRSESTGTQCFLKVASSALSETEFEVSRDGNESCIRQVLGEGELQLSRQVRLIDKRTLLRASPRAVRRQETARTIRSSFCRSIRPVMSVAAVGHRLAAVVGQDEPSRRLEMAHHASQWLAYLATCWKRARGTLRCRAVASSRFKRLRPFLEIEVTKSLKW